MRCRCDPWAATCIGPTFPHSTVPEPSCITSSRTTGGATKSGIRRAAITRSKSTRFRNRSAGDRREWTPTRWGSSWRSPQGSSAHSCWSPGCFGRGSIEPGPSIPRRFRTRVVSSDRPGHPCDLVSGTRINLPDRPHRGPRFNMTTTVGIRSKDGVVLAADKRASKGFFVGSKVVQKIFSLDGTTAVAIAGAMSDAEYLVNLAKAERRLLALRRGYPVSVKESAKLISNIVYSSMKSYNPFYVELVVAGVDHEGPHVYTSDMSGAITSEDFMSSGSGSPIAYGVLEQGFRKEFSLDEARKLAEAAERHRLVYDEPIDVGTLSRNLSEYLHEFTMYAVRPFGASVVIAGVDALGVQLIQVDPSGTTFKGSAFAIGQSADEALDTIVKGYRPDIGVEQAIALSTQAIEGVNGGKTQIEHGVVTASAKRFEHQHNANNAG